MVKFALGMAITLSAVAAAWSFYNADHIGQSSLFYLSQDALRTKTTDIRMRVRGMQKPADNIAVVAIDERSLEKNGQWPWPRSQIGRLIEELFRHGVEAVGIDVMYPEPSRTEVVSVLGELEELIALSPEDKIRFDEYKKRRLDREDQDGALARVLAKHRERLVIGAAFHVSPFVYAPYQRLCFDLAYGQTEEFRRLDREGYDFIHLLAEADLNIIEELPADMRADLQARLAERKGEEFEYCSQWLIEGQDPHYASWQAYGARLDEVKASGLNSALIPSGPWKLNAERIFNSTRYTGFLNVVPDIDGTVREIPLLVRRGPHIIPSMALRLAMIGLDADGGQISLVRNKLRPNFLAVKDLELTKEGEVIFRVPVDSEAKVRINFMGPKHTYPHISAVELLDSDESFIEVTQLTGEEGPQRLIETKLYPKADFLRGKTVILGATALGLYDLRVTPFDENYPGVEAHATVVDNIQRGMLLKAHPQEPPYMLLTLLILGVVLTLLVSYLGPLGGLGVSAVTVVGLAVSDYFFLFKNGVVVAVVFPVLFAVILYAVMTVYKYFTEEKQKRAVRGTFEKYVSPAIVAEVMLHPDNLKLGGRKERMSVFFSDVRGFTTISESLDPEKLSELLNLYLTPMTELVFKNNGTLDKYMGDAIMAFFGAPIASAHHAEDACRCALQNIAKLKELNARLQELGFEPIDIGIGINTGEMSVGNMGSESVRSYTVMGDAVNLGSRLEGINKQYGTHIIISEFTESELNSQFIRRPIDLVKVKGKEKPVKIFELIAEGEADEALAAKLKHFRLGHHLYLQQKWKQAIEEFNLASDAERDPVSQLYIRRCYEFLADPPPANWDGVFVMTSK